ncbi:MAG TPA: nuclear transport factor 2 family protein [Gemmatimonadaceae bacterium]|nr:nuclear transport factor 2 family protein [Gemmatimonadaceae bacterium]
MAFRLFGIVPDSMVLVALLAFAVGCTPPANRTIARRTAETEVRQAQRDRFEAMTRQDVAALDTLLDDEMNYVSTTADLQSKPQFIGSIKKQTVVYESIAPVEVKVRVYDGLALATGRAQMRVRNAAGVSSFGIRFTEVYLRRDGQWLLTAWEATRSKS